MDDLFGGSSTTTADGGSGTSVSGSRRKDRWDTPVISEQSSTGGGSATLGDCFTDPEGVDCGPGGTHARS